MRKFCFLPPPRPVYDRLTAFKQKNGQHLIVFMAGTQGTLSHWSRQFFHTSLAICLKHGYGGLLLGGTDPDISEGAVGWQEYVSLSDILPKADVIVHHGGIGTAAAAIEHGVPQLIIPRFASQPSNAECVKRLGVGAVIHDYSYTERQGADQISRLLADNEIKKRLRSYVGRCYCKKTLARLARFLECWPDVGVAGSV